MYYDRNKQRRHNANTLKNSGLTPSTPGIFPLRVDKPSINHIFDFYRDSGLVEYINGEYHIKYEITERSLDDIKASLKAVINERHQFTINQGIEIDFGDASALLENGQSERAGKRFLQTRSGDRINWLEVMSAAQLMINKGQGSDNTTPIRTSDNALVTVTAVEAADHMSTLLKGIAKQFEDSWQLKSTIEQAKNYEELKSIT